MLPKILLLAFVWATQSLLSSGSSPPLRTRSLLRRSQYNVWETARRSIASSGLQHRSTEKKNSTSLDKSWEDAVLFTYEAEQDLDSKEGNTSVSVGIEIACVTCYIRGTATTKFIHDPDFNISRAFDNLTDHVGDEVRGLGTEVADYVQQYIDDIADDLDDGIDMEDFELPPMDFDLNVDLHEIPEFRLQFQFDDFEVYMLIDTVLSAGATYTLNLYTSTTPAGFAVRDNLEVGVILTVDLILSVEGEINLTNGFHLRLDDGVMFELGIFSKEISDITIEGGEFEFLPVTVESAGVVFRAILRVGVQAGFEIASPDVTIAGKDIAHVSAGVEVGVYANIAEFITNVTLSSEEDDDCSLHVKQAYQLAIGAAAGASIAIQDITWGPLPETEIPIFYTTLANACAVRRSSTPSTSETTTTSAVIAARGEDENDNDMETTTIHTEATFVAVACQSKGLANCPMSLQITSKFTTTRTYVTVIPTDSEAELPESVRYTVTRMIPFGDGANQLFATSGFPTSYIPPTSTSSTKTGPSTDKEHDHEDDLDGNTDGVPRSTIIGVSVGLGVPFLFGCLAAILFLRRKIWASRKILPTPVEATNSTSPHSKTVSVSVVEERTP